MASYIGDYIDELGKVNKQVLLTVYLISQAQGKIQTSTQYDSNYLPNVFINNVINYSKRIATCELVVIPRRAKLWLNNDSYLSVPVPFRPSSTNYNQFFIEASFNLSITTVGKVGEKINSSWLKFYATKYP